MSFNILGTGMYVPPRIVDNSELETMVDTSDEWIRSRVGIAQRHVCTDEETSDLALKAARRALEAADTTPEQLDLILVATVSGEYTTPTMGCVLQKKLGASCPAYDINAACSAFIFLLETAAGWFARGRVKRMLVVGAEQLSRHINWSDRNTCVIFGDGAGAVVLGPGDGYVDSVLSCAGNTELITIPAYDSRSPFYENPPSEPWIHMNGQETFKFAVNAIKRDVSTLMERNGIGPEDVSLIVPHQANLRIIEAAAARLKLPKERFYVNIQRYGNTSSASIPMALDELSRSGRLKRGDLLILTAFGGGLSNAACVIKW